MRLEDLFRLSALILTTVALFLCSCRQAKRGESPPQQASFSKVLVRQVAEWDHYSGRLQSPQVVNLSSRVSGIITTAPFEEGAMVKANDLLFTIDERPFKAELQSREADVLSAKAQLAYAQSRFKRVAGLIKTGAVSAESYDEAAAAFEQAQARLSASEAARDLARLNHEWTQVRSPVTGKISRKYVTEGNLVTGGSGQATQLTVITSIDPMYCYVNAPESALLRYSTLASSHKAAGAGDKIPCSVQLENELSWTHHGVVDFVDNRVDRSTGTVELRCSLPNPDGALVSGLFARMRVPGTDPYTAKLVPDAAVGTDQNSRFLLVIGADDTIVRKPVQLGALFGKLRVIKSGVEAEDRILVNALQQLRPGTKVTPREEPIGAEAESAISAISSGNEPDTEPQTAAS